MPPETGLPGRQRVLEVKTGISFKNKPDDDPDVSIGIARLYPSLKFTLAKVKVHRETVREGEYVEVKKTVIPLLLVGRLEESRLRLDEHDGEKVFTILGSKAQLENCNALLAHVLPKGVKSLEHGLRIAYEDLQRFDSQLNGEDRAFLKDRGCEAALPDPALNVEGVVFARGTLTDPEERPVSCQATGLIGGDQKLLATLGIGALLPTSLLTQIVGNTAVEKLEPREVIIKCDTVEQMESFLASNECFLGDPGGKATIMYVGLFYHTMLQKLWQHPARMSLIGAVAAFCELVPGAEVFPVDRERWAKMRRDTTVRLPLDMQKSIEMVFSLSFLEAWCVQIPPREPVQEGARDESTEYNFSNTRLPVRSDTMHPGEQFGRKQFGRLSGPLLNPGRGNVFEADYSSDVTPTLTSRDLFYRGPTRFPLPTVHVDKELLGYDLDPSGALRPRPPWRFDCGIEEEIELVSEEFADELPATEVRTMCSILGISHLLPVEKRGRGRKKARKHEVENWNECAFAGVAGQFASLRHAQALPLFLPNDGADAMRNGMGRVRVERAAPTAPFSRNTEVLIGLNVASTEGISAFGHNYAKNKHLKRRNRQE